MLAGIVKGADLAILAGNDDDALLENVLGDVGARFAELVHMPDDMPAFEKDLLLFFLEHLGVIEIGCGHR